MKDVKDAAQEYIDKGWQVVPLAKGTKACVDANWTNLIFQPEDFRAGDNLGIRSVNGLVDIDCDAAEVVALAKYFLPSTGATYGRQSKPASHWLYKSDFDKIIVYKDQGAEADKATLIEIRVKHQSMAPPSVHPNGEAIQWVGELGGAPDVDPTVLLRRVRLLATASLLVRYYNPPGNRHDWGIAIAGLFRGLGITEEEAFLVVDKTAEHVGDDDKKDRLTSVRSTYSRPDDEPIAGAKALKDLLSHPERFLGSIRKIWGTSGGAFIVDDKDRIIADNQENLRRAFKKLEVVVQRLRVYNVTARF